MVQRAFAFRAGIEGRISVLRRRYGLERCPYHGEEGMGRWVGWGIAVHNLAKISEKQAARQGRVDRGRKDDGARSCLTGVSPGLTGISPGLTGISHRKLVLTKRPFLVIPSVRACLKFPGRG